jgi:ketosteroid isomerase-like protein
MNFNRTALHAGAWALLSLLAIVATASTVAQTVGPAQADPETLIQETLRAQVTAWNAGDIPGFMDGYVRGDELRFASGGTVQHGWQKTLERYQSRYSSRELMGELTFADLKILVLSPDYAEVFGRFQLKREAAVGDASGLFTLLMERNGDRWLVRHDHTSAAE